jgi:CheY-like chemotaxis protein
MPALMERQQPDVIIDMSEATVVSESTDDILDERMGGRGNDAIDCRRGLSVLVIDDYRDAADSLAILVRLWGHDARVAYDGAAALATATEELPDVMFVDIGMPELNGFQLALYLRRQSRFADTLLVAITGWADHSHRQLWEGAFDHYLIKPVDPPALECLLLDRGRLVQSRIGMPNSGLVAAGIAGWPPTAVAVC